jgi:hypothetical protein
MTLAYQRLTAMLLLIYISLFLSGVYYCLSVFWGAVQRMSELELEQRTKIKFLVKLVKSGSVYFLYELLLCNTMLLKSFVFWGIMPCSPAKANRRFGEHVASIFRVDEQIKQETSMKKVASTAVP